MSRAAHPLRALAVAVAAAAGAAARRPAAAQVTVSVSAPASLAPGEPALVRVEVTAPASATLRLAPPDVSPFTVTSATRLTDPGARRGWQRQEWRYVLAPPAGGAPARYAFEPFTAEAQGVGLRPTWAQSRAWTLVVRPPSVAAVLAPGPTPATAGRPPGVPLPAAAAPAGAIPPTGVTFTARVTPSAVYVGQQATYELTVGVSAEARARIRRNPEFVPAELRGVLAYDLPATHRAEAAGDLHVYRRALFPLAPGPVRVPAARLTYALAAGPSYFSPERTTSVQSNAVQLTALAPPAAGRPAAWSGAVGALRAAARTDAGRVRAGDAVEYSVELEGTGNLALLARPRLAVPWADVIPAGDTAAVDSAAAQVRGRRTFTWLLTPRAPGRYTTPAVDYPYFDPAARAYASAAAPPVAVEVVPGVAPTLAEAVPPAGRPRERLAIRTRWRGATAPVLAAEAPFWAALGAVPLPAAVLWAAAGARVRRRRGAAGRAAPRGGAPASGAAALRAQLDAALAERVGFGVADCGTPERLAAALRRVGVTADTAGRSARLVRALDAAAYGEPAARAADGALDPLARELAAVRRDVDREARARDALVGGRPAEGGAWVARALLVCSLASAAGAMAACARSTASEADARAARAFAAGVSAYQRGDVDRARAGFLAAAAEQPRAPDAWADAGTAAWAAADTVGAAVAWQRALRLEPTAADVRERLARLPTAQDGPVAGVLPVPPNAPAALALGLGLLAALLALPTARRRAGARAWAAAWGASLAAGAAAAALAARARPDALAVVADAGTLRAEPALDADPGARADATDLARVLARSGTWTRVRLDGGREGWIADDRLAPLVGPAERARAGDPPGPVR